MINLNKGDVAVINVPINKYSGFSNTINFSVTSANGIGVTLFPSFSSGTGDANLRITIDVTDAASLGTSQLLVSGTPAARNGNISIPLNVSGSVVATTTQPPQTLTASLAESTRIVYGGMTETIFTPSFSGDTPISGKWFIDNVFLQDVIFSAGQPRGITYSPATPGTRVCKLVLYDNFGRPAEANRQFVSSFTATTTVVATTTTTVIPEEVNVDIIISAPTPPSTLWRFTPVATSNKGQPVSYYWNFAQFGSAWGSGVKTVEYPNDGVTYYLELTVDFSNGTQRRVTKTLTTTKPNTVDAVVSVYNLITGTANNILANAQAGTNPTFNYSTPPISSNPPSSRYSLGGESNLTAFVMSPYWVPEGYIIEAASVEIPVTGMTPITYFGDEVSWQNYRNSSTTQANESDRVVLYKSISSNTPTLFNPNTYSTMLTKAGYFPFYSGGTGYPHVNGAIGTHSIPITVTREELSAGLILVAAAGAKTFMDMTATQYRAFRAVPFTLDNSTLSIDYGGIKLYLRLKAI